MLTMRDAVVVEDVADGLVVGQTLPLADANAGQRKSANAAEREDRDGEELHVDGAGGC